MSAFHQLSVRRDEDSGIASSISLKPKYAAKARPLRINTCILVPTPSQCDHCLLERQPSRCQFSGRDQNLCSSCMQYSLCLPPKNRKTVLTHAVQTNSIPNIARTARLPARPVCRKAALLHPLASTSLLTAIESNLHRG